MGLIHALVRILAIVGKELVEMLRRPGAVLSLVLGPFLIMAVFGLGFGGVRRPLDTIVVATPQSGLPTDPQRYQELAGGGFRIVGVSADKADAEARLAAREVDVVILAPDDVETQFRAGKPSTIQVEVNLVDPVEASYANIIASGLAAAVNREILTQAAAQGEGYLLGPEASADPARRGRRADTLRDRQRGPIGNRV